MFKTNLKIALRNLVKDRQFALLNFAGLSTGLACTFLIYLWVNDELQVDKYNIKDKQLFQVMVNDHGDHGIKTGSYTPGPLANALSKEIPEVEYATSVVPASWFPSKGVITAGDTHISAGSQFAGKDYFNIFTCPIIEGDRNRLFADQATIAISNELARKLFSTMRDVVGKTVKWEYGEFSGNYTISSVFKENPANATAHFDILFNFSLFAEKRTGMLSWQNSDPDTYVIVKKNADIGQLNNKIRGFLRSKDKLSKTDLFLAKFSDRYLRGQYENGVQSGGRITYVRLFSVIALFILIIACINFMNLSTAKASRRIKEVGIKKVMGARRSTLVLQYMSESMLMTLLSLFAAVTLVWILVPQFNDITGKQISLVLNGYVLLSGLGIAVITGLVAGSYPALYLSGFNAAAVLKGKLKNAVGEVLIRKGLVVFQFALSVMLIVGVLVVYRQISYIQSRDLGYSRDNIVHFEIPLDNDSVKMKTALSFVNELKNIPGVVNASSYYHNLTGDHGSIGGVQWPGKNPANNIDFANLEVGYHFMETMGMQMKEGRNFSANQHVENEIIFNEAAIEKMGLKDPVGKTITFWDQRRVIVGVVKNFNFESLYQTVKPCFFQVYPVMPNIMVKITAGSEKEVLPKIQKVFQDYHKGLPFDYHFLDDNYNALYTSELRVGVLSRYFAGLAILISCLGLFGLAAFTAQKRQKEIGIRKVVGASVANVVVMLSADFLKLVILAMGIAFPLAWWATNRWLSDFAYHINIGYGIFLVAGISTLLVTLFTISFQAIKAAVMNPVKSLKTE